MIKILVTYNRTFSGNEVGSAIEIQVGFVVKNELCMMKCMGLFQWSSL